MKKFTITLLALSFFAINIVTAQTDKKTQHQQKPDEQSGYFKVVKVSEKVVAKQISQKVKTNEEIKVKRVVNNSTAPKHLTHTVEKKEKAVLISDGNNSNFAEEGHGKPIEFRLAKLKNSPESIELIHSRDARSRTFRNTDGSFTKQQTYGCFHYKDEKGRWLSLDGKLAQNSRNPNIYEITKTNLPISIDLSDGKTVMTLEKGQFISYGNNIELVILDKDFNEIDRISAKSSKENSIKEKEILIKNVWNNIDRRQQVDYWFVKTDYILNTKPNVNISEGYLVFEDKVILPEGWQIVRSDGGTEIDLGWQGDILILNSSGKEVGRFHMPVYYDNSTINASDESCGSGQKSTNTKFNDNNDKQDKSITGIYQIKKTTDGYVVSVLVSLSWLLDNDRIYPVTIDPNASNTYSSGNISSCFYPVFNTVNMNVTIPAGGTVSSTSSVCTYRAQTGAYLSEGWVGFEGNVALDGYYYCNVNVGGDCAITGTDNTIANGTYPTGIVPFTIYVARDWGGAGCNTTYGLVRNNTWIETVTYTVPAGPSCSGNDVCATACSMTLDGTCYNSTNVGMADNWVGTPGCQTLDGHPDAWFTATPTLSTLSITVDNLSGGGSSVFWSEDFENGCGSGCLLPNSGWTETSTGGNSASANRWYISCQSNGNAAGDCGSGCGSDETLHMASTTMGDTSPFGVGANYDAGQQTNKRANSPTIDCSGRTGITMDFNYIMYGEAGWDYATVEYYDGASWSTINSPPMTALCGSQGRWTARSVPLPASADNNPDVRIGFNWTNNSTVGTDPSFAVDDITLSVITGGPDAELIVVSSDNDLCTGTFTVENSNCASVPFTLNTTVTPGTPYWWTVSFSDGSTGTFDICADESGGVPPDCDDNETCATAEVLTLVTPCPTCDIPVVGPDTVAYCFTDCNTGASDVQNVFTGGCGTIWSYQEVWYSFTATNTYVDILLTNADFPNSYLSVYQPNCNTVWVINGECYTPGTGGSNSILGMQVTMGETYIISVSSQTDGDGGNFDLCVYDYDDPAACATITSITPTPPPDVSALYPSPGSYPPNTTVNFCYDISQYLQIGLQYLHGIVLDIGSGWLPFNPATDVTVSLNCASCGDMGAGCGGGLDCEEAVAGWQWFADGVVDINVDIPNEGLTIGDFVGAGWFFLCDNGNVDPGDHGGDPNLSWGDGCYDWVGAPTWSCLGDPAAGFGLTWQVCFNLTTKDAVSCAESEDLTVKVRTYSDGQTGSYANTGCNNDLSTSGGNIMSCCPSTDFTWTGSIDSDWFDPDNWAACAVPDANTDVTIPAGCFPNYPEVYSGGNPVCASLTIDGGAITPWIILITGKTLDCGGNITINGILTMQNGSFIECGGDWDNSGVFNPALGTVTFDGSIAQSIGGSNSTTFNNLIINNSSTGVTLNINTNIGSSGMLTLTDGALILNQNTLTVQNSATTAITGGSANSYIVSETDAATNNSILQWNIGGTTGSHIFPFGTTAGEYIPVTFNNSGASGNISISTRPTSLDDNEPWATGVTIMSGIGTNVTTALDRWWNITSSVASPLPAVTLTLTYRGSENTTSSPTDVLGLQHWTGSTWNDGKGGAGSTVTSTGTAGLTTGVNSVTASGLTEFSPYVIVREVAPLPIELLYFNAEVIENNRALLIWATASETNNDFFTIEKCRDEACIVSDNWKFVANIKGAGNSIEILNYSAIDESPYLGTSYYRLKQTDYDGKYEYFDIKAVNISKTSDFNIRPNPAKNRLEVLFTESADAKVFIKILDVRGKLVYSRWFETVKGHNQIKIDLHTFSKGMYVITLINNQVYKANFVKE